MTRPAINSGPLDALLVTRNLPPLRGGMERLCLHIALSLSNGGYNLSVIGPEGCAAHLPAPVRVREIPYRPLVRFFIAASRAVCVAARRGPVVVIAGSGLTAPFAWFAARSTNARFVVYLHGLDIIARSALYQFFWLPFIRRADLILVNSDSTGRLAQMRGIQKNRIEVLHPGTEVPGPDAEARRLFREEHGLGERPVLLSVGRLTPRKGLAEFIKLALPAILAQHPDAVFLVIGADADDAARPASESQLERIFRAANEAGVSAALRVLPPCDDAMLTSAYRAADAHVFPVLDLPGDVEGFGMVAIEAAAHGVPTVGFRVGGVPDAIVEGVSGSLIEPHDYGGFAVQVSHWVGQGGRPMLQARCVAAATGYGWPRFGERLHSLLGALLGNGA